MPISEICCDPSASLINLLMLSEARYVAVRQSAMLAHMQSVAVTVAAVIVSIMCFVTMWNQIRETMGWSKQPQCAMLRKTGLHKTVSANEAAANESPALTTRAKAILCQLRKGWSKNG